MTILRLEILENRELNASGISVSYVTLTKSNSTNLAGNFRGLVLKNSVQDEGRNCYEAFMSAVHAAAR
jgi:hypothetical protein